MDARTLEALKGSIAKWEAIVAGTGEDDGPDNCPLCQVYIFGKRTCAGCPVESATSKTGCDGSPYVEWSDYIGLKATVFDETSRRLAQAELDFLRSLLPAEEA